MDEKHPTKDDPIVKRGRATWTEQSAALSKKGVPKNHQLFISKNNSNCGGSTLGTWFDTIDEALEYLYNSEHAEDVEFHVVDGLTSAIDTLLEATLKEDRCKQGLEDWRAEMSGAPPSLEPLTL